MFFINLNRGVFRGTSVTIRRSRELGQSLAFSDWKQSTKGNISDFCWRADGLTGRSCRSTKRTSRVVAWMRTKLLPLSAKPPQMQDTPVLQSELKRSDKHTKPILHASAKIDRRSFREIFGRAGDFADPKSKMNALRQRLVVKNKVIRIFQQWKF